MDPGLKNLARQFKAKIGNYSFALADSSQPSVSKKASQQKPSASLHKSSTTSKLIAPATTSAKLPESSTSLNLSELPTTIPKSSNDAAESEKSKRDAILRYADSYTNARAHRDQLAAFGIGAQSSSGKQFSLLQKIVTHMRDRFLKGETQPLNVDEMLEELDIPLNADSELQNGVSEATRRWLEFEALPSNSKLRTLTAGEDQSNSASGNDKQRFVFRPSYPVRDRKGLLSLLQRHAAESLGGLLLDDLSESFAGARKALHEMREQSVVEFVERADRRTVVFYDDVRDSRVPLDIEFTQLFTGCSVQQVDERHIENYLRERGLLASFDEPTAPGGARATKVSRKRKHQKTAIRDNVHLESTLHDYGDSM